MHIYMLSLVFYDCILINLPREETVNANATNQTTFFKYIFLKQYNVFFIKNYL